MNAVLDMDATQIEPPPSFGTGLRQDFIRGMARTDSGFIILLDVGRVVSVEDIADLAASVSAINLDGKLIDRPVIERAREILEEGNSVSGPWGHLRNKPR